METKEEGTGKNPRARLPQRVANLLKINPKLKYRVSK